MTARSPAKLARDRLTIQTLYFQGKTQWEIAEQLGIRQPTVSRDLKALQRLWSRESVKLISEHKAKELAKIDTLEREYWAGWLRSCEPKETDIKKQIKPGTTDVPGDTRGGRREQTMKTEQMIGDKAWLDGVRECIKMRNEILGLTNISKTLNVDLHQLNDQQLERLARGDSILDVLSNPSAINS